MKHILLGQILRETIITFDGRVQVDFPGGGLLYAAGGLGVWEADTGLVGWVGGDFPVDWIDKLAAREFDVQGLKRSLKPLDARFFAAYDENGVRGRDNPLAHFARLGLTLPRTLLGYSKPLVEFDSHTQPGPFTLRASDLPPEYLEASAAHICPVDFLTHSLLPSALRQGSVSTITLDPAPGYMNPTFWLEIPSLVAGLTAFISSEEKLASLFKGRSVDLWEMAEALADFGCEMVVVLLSAGGQLLYDNATHARWHIPAYPVRTVDPTGVDSAFCGGFLAGYRKTYLPLAAALHGSVSASLAMQGTGPFFAMEGLPELRSRRLEVLEAEVRSV